VPFPIASPPWTCCRRNSCGGCFRVDVADFLNQLEPDAEANGRLMKAARTWGAWVEANALVMRPEVGRRLCRDAILRYVPEDAIDSYQDKLELVQGKSS
jgi:hypothetical protein